MNVLFVNATRRWGGVKSWTLRVAGGLARRGHRVSVVLRPGTSYTEACREAGLDVHELRFGPDWNPVAIGSLVRLLRRLDTAVVVTNVSKDNRIGGPAAAMLGIPVLQRVGGPGDITDRFQVRVEQQRYVRHVVTPAAFIRDTLARFPWMRAGERVTVVHNGVDLDRFRPGVGRGRLRELLDLPPEVPLVAVTSQLTAIKGHRVLLDALASLPGEPTAAFIGTGSEEPALRDRAAALGLERRVRFVGFRRDLPELLEDAHVAVLPSLQEGFPNSVIEFLAKGKATVASDLAGIPEAIEDGVHGRLVPPGDPVALANVLTELLGDPDQRARLGSTARARAETEFGEPLMVDRVERLLAEVIG